MAGAASAVTAPILVVDAESGKVLYSQGATDPWYPASITKLMTTYVALDMVRQGKVSLDTLLTVSPAAAAEPPSKMGFKPGTQIKVDADPGSGTLLFTDGGETVVTTTSEERRDLRSAPEIEDSSVAAPGSGKGLIN